MQPRADRPHMPGYGLRPATAGLLDWEWAEQRLVAAHTYVIGTVRPGGRPHAVPVWAIWHDDALVFSTARTARKVHNLTADPRCVATVEAAGDTVVVEGVAAEVTDPVAARAIAARYADKYGDPPPEGDGSSWWRIAPVAAFGFIERDGLFTSTATRWTWR
jgi:PPOX class probable F420-dependent enzyme